ncbi:MAG: hypothetical protein NVS9B14_01040 [Candidatus Acidiferrum sp.]
MAYGVQGETLLRALLELCDDAVIEIGVDGRIAHWNRGAKLIYGYSQEEMMGQSLAQLVPIYEIAEFETLLRDLERGEIRNRERTERLKKNGDCVVVNVRRTALRDANGKVTGLLECSRQPSCNFDGLPGERELRLLVDQMPVMVWTTDRHLQITSNWGQGFQKSEFGYGRCAGRTILEFLACDRSEAEPVAKHMEALSGKSGRFEYRRAERVLEVQVEPLRSPEGATIGCLGVALDVTERKRSEDQVFYQATHDALTGLANYREFIEAFERELKRAARTHGTFAVLLLDLDGLKQINDRQGHLAGNRALKRLANAMREHSRAVDVAARYGGDEFALLLIDADLQLADRVAGRIAELLRDDADGMPLGVSIGMASYPADGRTGQDLLEVADQRLYHEKKNPEKRLQIPHENSSRSAR